MRTTVLTAEARLSATMQRCAANLIAKATREKLEAIEAAEKTAPASVPSLRADLVALRARYLEVTR